MSYSLRHPLFAFLLVFFATTANAQSGKSFFKEGEALRKQHDLEGAVEKYSLAISVDPRMMSALQARAESYELLGRKGECAQDRRRMAEIDPGHAEHATAAAKAYLELDSLEVARTLCDQALRVDPKAMDALQTKVRACLGLGDLDCATQASDAALALKATTDTYYLHGLVRTAARDYKTAEFDLDKVLEWNHLYEPAYVAAAEVQLRLYEQYSGLTMKMRTLDKAIQSCTRALELNPASTDALFTRSKATSLQKEFSRSIDDVSRCIALGRTDGAVYYQRALYYQGFGQHQNAVNDLNRVILEDPKNIPALLLRAEAHEANLDMDGALRDLQLAQKAMEGDPNYGAEQRKKIDDARVRIAQQIYEMNRESDAPGITVIEPFRRGDVAQVSMALAYVKVSGHVRDKSHLKAITVNGHPADFAKDEKDPQFVVSIPLERDELEITVQAVDIYDNLSSEVLKVERTEGIPPSVTVTLPKPTGNREVTIPAGKEEIHVEGKVTDASLIRLVAVNGVNASYVPDQLDPDFSVKVDVKDKDRFVVRAEDQFGNATEVVYSVARKVEVVAAKQTTDNSSTGVTWIIHIENTNYRNFSALQNTAADMAKMQKTFANYNVSRTVTKKNLSKEQMERFFNVELRDLVRTNKVNTILVWYSGHGRTVGGKAYWVPVDAKKDDIYSYFNYGPLKSQMQNYSESVNNTLVVSDAAGTDPSFYELTR